LEVKIQITVLFVINLMSQGQGVAGPHPLGSQVGQESKMWAGKNN